jgi:uncharacterized protein
MSIAPTFNAAAVTPAEQPWWRVGMVWLVIGGPLVVVVAAIVTAVIAVRGADPVITEIPAAMAPGATSPSADTPAVQARNHAATAGR